VNMATLPVAQDCKVLVFSVFGFIVLIRLLF
jgi:hypothetical protein